jgi:hypothetical protein
MKRTPGNLAVWIPGLFVLLFGLNTLAVYTHNRLNAFIYLLLLLSYILLYSPDYWRVAEGLRQIFFDFSSRQAVLSWFFWVFAPNLLALYYLDFRLLWANFGLDILLTGCLFYLQKKERTYGKDVL